MTRGDWAAVLVGIAAVVVGIAAIPAGEYRPVVATAAAVLILAALIIGSISLRSRFAFDEHPGNGVATWATTDLDCRAGDAGV